MKKNLTITIGIPAYNEELNIKFLLKALLNQKVENGSINEIIVISDGSTDITVELAKSVEDSRLKIIDRQIRIGNNAVQNQIIKLAKGDILVLLDADVLPVGAHFIEEIAEPIIGDKNVGLVGADTQSTSPATFVESIISTSHELKKSLYKKINNDNIYLCHGRANAFSKDFYSNIFWPKNVPEDAYSYLTCIKKGFKFVFAPEAKVIFRSPATLADHFKQSNRFVNGKKELEKYFPSNFVKAKYSYSKLLLVQTVIEYLFRNPIATLSYLFITAYIRIFGIKKNTNQSEWDISASTKRVIYEKV